MISEYRDIENEYIKLFSVYEHFSLLTDKLKAYADGNKDFLKVLIHPEAKMTYEHESEAVGMGFETIGEEIELFRALNG